ncbi:MAG: hypothetical protein ACLFWL_05355 [Candidatus Brocadiia bacterium]
MLRNHLPSRSWWFSRQVAFSITTFILLFAANAVRADETLFKRAFRMGAVDREETRGIKDGETVKPNPEELETTLGFSRRREGWALQRCRTGHYLLVLKKQTTVGSMVVSSPPRWSSNGGEIRYLKGGVKGDPDPDDESQWEKANLGRQREGLRWFTFPPETKTRAFLFTDTRRHGRSRLDHWLFFKNRLHTLTPAAVGTAEDAPFGSSANALPAGRTWVNTRPDPEEHSRTSGKILRAPVSEINPSFYILSWDKARRIDGIFLSSNAVDYKLYTYTGNPAANPAVASDDDWDRLRPPDVKKTRAGHQIALKPVETTALKLKILKIRPQERDDNDAVARIQAFHALAYLGDRPVPKMQRTSVPPFEIEHEIPRNGLLSFRIKDEQGNHVRYLVAQQMRAEGSNSEVWDLRDDQGIRVKPGRYEWESLSAPPLELRYQMTPYPNIGNYFSDRTPWLRGHSGRDGWLADHACINCGTTRGDKVYFGAGCAEGGVAFIECELSGKKLWGRHDFGPWTGPRKLAASKEAVFIEARRKVFRLDPEDGHRIQQIFRYGSANRSGRLRGFAAWENKVYTSFSRPAPFLENATTASMVDHDHCIPSYPEEVPEKPEERVPANPRAEFLRLLRLQSDPPGQGRHSDRWPMYIDSTERRSRHQDILVAFKKPVPVGSVAFPHIGGNLEIQVSALKPDAAYPPRAGKDKHWEPFPVQNEGGWDVIPAPKSTRTRALRIRISKPGDELSDIMAGDGGGDAVGATRPDGLGVDEKRDEGIGLGQTDRWQAHLAGLKILRRRVKNVFESAKVRVSSGTVTEQGVWEAERDQPLSEKNPAIYLMEWDRPKELCGLAIKDMDGAVTKIDVWDGPSETPIEMRGDSHWREVATYRQKRRFWYEPSFARNHLARYMDGYADFHGVEKTRAVRLRVVKQWYDHGPHRPYGLREDRGGMSLDTTRCRIWGVAPLVYLGGEPPVDTVQYRRFCVYNGKSGKLEKETEEFPGGSFSFGPDGRLYSLNNARICRVDRRTGEATPVSGKLQNPRCLEAAPDGQFYVFHGYPQQRIRVYDSSGKFIRSIGHRGGLKPGRWDPKRFGRVSALFVDSAKSLWVVESEDKPRRVIQYKTDGRFVKEFTGNTFYGGGGALNPYDKSQVFFGKCVFRLDWQSGKTGIKGLLRDRMHTRGRRNDVVPIKKDGRMYLVSAPLMNNKEQSLGAVYLYDSEEVRARAVAAFGNASAWSEFRDPDILALMKGGRVPAQHRFIWCDRNGDGEVDPAEVELTIVGSGRDHDPISWFDSELNCLAGPVTYRVKEWLDDGTPIYERMESPAPGCFRFSDGRVFDMEAPAAHPHGGYSHRGVHPGGRGANHGGLECHVRDPEGEVQWRYRTVGWSGLHVEPWIPGYVAHQFSVIGRGTPEKGDLGEFVVVHSNTGQWNIWTADGFLAGPIFRHKFDPESQPFSARKTAERMRRMDPITTGQEHFHGYFTQTSDGRYFAIAGHNQINIIEVLGIEKFTRRSGMIEVSAEAIRRQRKREIARARREIRSRAPVVYCCRPEKPPRVDGEVSEGEWSSLSSMPGREKMKFGMAHDNRYLYLCWQGVGSLKNTGGKFQRYFKTGGCLDLKLQTDPGADPGRKRPAKGDVRLLITYVEDRPEVVLYEPVAPDAPESESWKTHTAAMGTTSFDRVVRLENPVVKRQGGVVEARIELEKLGLRPRKGMRVKLDWGVLISKGGFGVQQRLYWTNKLANGTSDEALEARLKPHLWGYAVFCGKGRPEGGMPDVEGSMQDLEGEQEEMDEEEIEDLLLGD